MVYFFNEQQYVVSVYVACCSPKKLQQASNGMDKITELCIFYSVAINWVT